MSRVFGPGKASFHTIRCTSKGNCGNFVKVLKASIDCVSTGSKRGLRVLLEDSIAAEGSEAIRDSMNGSGMRGIVTSPLLLLAT